MEMAIYLIQNRQSGRSCYWIIGTVGTEINKQNNKKETLSKLYMLPKVINNSSVEMSDHLR